MVVVPLVFDGSLLSFIVFPSPRKVRDHEMLKLLVEGAAAEASERQGTRKVSDWSAASSDRFQELTGNV